MDQRIRKLMTMHKAFHPRDDVDRLCVKKRGRMRTCHHWRQHWRIDTTTWRLHRKAHRKTNYSHQKQHWRHKDQQNNNNQKTKWEEKLIYGCFKQLTSNISHEKIWTWLRKGNIKRETESFLITAQNNAIRTNYIKARIDKTQQNSRWGCVVIETKPSIT